MIHHVFANRSNVGDWLSAKGIQSELPQPVVEHLCDEPFVDSTLRALAGLAANDLVVIGGGGLFMDYFLPFWQGLLQLKNNFRCVIWGAGYCDLKAEPSRPPVELLNQVIARCSLCIVRDELTRSALRGSSPLPPAVVCPSLLMVDAMPAGHGVLHIDNYTTVGAAAFDIMDGQARRFAASTGRAYRRSNHRIEAGHEVELERVLSLYAQSDIVVSSGLHGCILGVAAGRPVVAVSGDHKIDAFMASAGLADWTLEPDRVGLLPGYLERLAAQPLPAGFVERVRADNRRVASKVVELMTRPIDGIERVAR